MDAVQTGGDRLEVLCEDGAEVCHRSIRAVHWSVSLSLSVCRSVIGLFVRLLSACRSPLHCHGTAHALPLGIDRE